MLAFGIDAWWTTRGERADEQIHLSALQIQFDETLELLRLQILQLEEAEEATKQLLSFDSKTAEADLNGFMGFIGQSLSPGRLNFPSGALAELIAAGELRIVTDRDLAARLAAWSSFTAEVYENATFLLENRDHRFVPFMLGYGLNGLRVNPRLADYPPSLFEPEIEALFADPRFEGHLAVRANQILNNLDRHRSSAEEANAILTLIQQNMTDQAGILR